uniref:DUF19 domain-containing protein n=1 Tax=Caenorhabditis tropicalis TaxID=1561998 RepID=A0A1I7T7T4_9PELO
MILFLLLLLINLFNCQTTKNSLDCDFLSGSFEYQDDFGNPQNYTGECCTPEAMEKLDNSAPDWKTLDKTNVVMYLIWNNLCHVSTTSTTTLPPTTTSTKCVYKNANCCNTEAEAYLDGQSGLSKLLNYFSDDEDLLERKGLCGSTTTTGKC